MDRRDDGSELELYYGDQVRKTINPFINSIHLITFTPSAQRGTR
jgi:hypothetical protein